MIIYSMKTYQKNGKNWEKIYETDDTVECLYNFANDMRTKYIDNAPTITRVVRKVRCYAYCLVTVYYNNGTCTEYKCEP